jgi:DNA-binding response OmpR family regulator
VVRTLRTEANWVPVLMLSAKDGEYDQADGLDYGADDYLHQTVLLRGAAGPASGAARRNLPARPAILAAGEVTWIGNP